MGDKDEGGSGQSSRGFNTIYYSAFHVSFLLGFIMCVLDTIGLGIIHKSSPH